MKVDLEALTAPRSKTCHECGKTYGTEVMAQYCATQDRAEGMSRYDKVAGRIIMVAVSLPLLAIVARLLGVPA